MPLIQGRHGYLRLGTDVVGSNLPVYNWGITNPRNIVTGQPLGNTWATNFAEGMQTTRFTFSVMLRNNTTEGMALAFWQRFLSRTWTSGFDDTTAFSGFLYSGRRKFTLANAKAESFTLTIQKGSPIGLSCVMVCPSIPTISDVTVADYTSTVDSAAPLMFDQCTFTGLGTNVYSIELTYANNHIPNAPLNATKFAAAYDAGPVTAGISVTVSEETGAAPIDAVTGATISLTSSVSRVFTLGQIVVNNTRDVGVNMGAVFKTFNGTILGGTSSQPITVA